MSTSIEWTQRPGTRGETWNPTKGCILLSPGCANCYAKTFAERWRGVKGHAYEKGFDPHEAPWHLDKPLSWKAPRTVFVNSMSDLFLEQFTDEYIAAVFSVMALCPQHTFIVLTKRAERMRAWFDWAARQDAGSGEKGAPAALWNALTEGPGIDVHRPRCALLRDDGSGVWCDCDIGADTEEGPPIPNVWPLPNVWLGVTCENKRHGLPRLDALRATPAAVRLVSFEPLLEDLGDVDLTGIDWAIVGGESGPGAREFLTGWARGIKAAANRAGTAFFMKQLGADAVETRTPLGGDVVHIGRKGAKNTNPADFPADLQVRAWPEVIDGA